MSALSILIIRHAEKPNEAWAGPGMTPEGIADQKSLVIRGWQRAGSWSALFGAGLGGNDFPQPSAIYATNPTAVGSDDDKEAVIPSEAATHANRREPSQRPFETIIPLASRLKVTANINYSLGQESELVTEVIGRTGAVLICWEHKAIGESILPAIAGAQVLPLPRNWDGARYDVVLRFDRAEHGAAWSFRQLFPRLLSGDSDVPME
jgi:hypothetical protein